MEHVALFRPEFFQLSKGSLAQKVRKIITAMAAMLMRNEVARALSTPWTGIGIMRRDGTPHPSEDNTHRYSHS
jgi:hypothetical protein